MTYANDFTCKFQQFVTNKLLELAGNIIIGSVQAFEHAANAPTGKVYLPLLCVELPGSAILIMERQSR